MFRYPDTIQWILMHRNYSSKLYKNNGELVGLIHRECNKIKKK